MWCEAPSAHLADSWATPRPAKKPESHCPRTTPQQQLALKKKGDFTIHACTVKSRPSRTSLLMTKSEEWGEKMLIACPSWMSSYLCRLCTVFVQFGCTRGGIHPPH